MAACQVAITTDAPDQLATVPTPARRLTLRVVAEHPNDPDARVLHADTALAAGNQERCRAAEVVGSTP